MFFRQFKIFFNKHFHYLIQFPMSDIHLVCEKCNKYIPHMYFKIHSKQCRGKCPIDPILAELFLSRINMLVILNQAKSQKAEEIKCKYCSELLNSKNMEDHVYTCQKLDVKCPYCSNTFPASTTNKHLQNCLITLTSNQINMKDDEYCQKLRGCANPLISTQKEFLVEKLVSSLKLSIRGCQRRTIERDKTLRTFNKQMIPALSLQDSECSFCKVDFINLQKVQDSNCGHTFHPKCLETWTHKAHNCPRCLKQIF